MVGFDHAAMLIGAGCIAMAFGGYDVVRARGRRDWPVVEGEIVDSQIVNQGTNFLPSWQSHVRYRYRVGGVQYEGNRNTNYSRADFRWPAEREAKQFPLGEHVRVQISPDDPASGVLETAGMGRSYGTIVVGVLVSAYGIYELAA